MKKIFLILSVAVVILLSGCSEYLGIKPRGYEVAYKLEHYAGLIYGKELYMLNEAFPYFSFEYTTDKDGYANVYSILGVASSNAYKMQGDIFREEDVCGEWNTHAEMLYTINIVVNEVMNAVDGTEEERRAIQSEARMLRAWHTFMMAQYFSKPYDASTAATDLSVPIITTASTTGTDFPRKTVKEVYEFVISEMEESLPYLQDTEEHLLRVFKATGYAMLGKVYWMMGEYEKALVPFETAYATLHSHSNTFFVNYNTLLDDEGKIQNYPIDGTKNPELLYNFNLMHCLFLGMYPEYYNTILLALKSDVIMKYFERNDTRLALITGMKSGKTAYKSLKATEVYYTNLTKMATDIGITIPDLYMMYSECLARTGHVEDAKSIIYEFRRNRMPESSATIPATANSKDGLVKLIVAERVKEYFGYGNLWFDMRRLWNDPLFQDMKQMYTHTDGTTTYTLTEERLVMRIPPSIMLWHPEYIDNE